jgi:Ca-activated chloride channel family protein
MKTFKLLLLLIIIPTFAQAQPGHILLREGNKKYKSEDYTAAEEQYRKSLEKEKTSRGNYNLGNSIYQQERYEDAIKYYENALNQADNNTTRARAWHNLGNAYFQTEEFDKSIDAYKNALRMNPEDLETKLNLAKAQMIQRQQQQQQQEQEQENQEQENQEQNQDQQQQQQNEEQNQEQNQEQQEQQNEENQDPQNQQNQQTSEEQQKDLSKEEARRLLEVMDDEEQKVLEKLRKSQSKSCNSKKDW